MSVSGAAARILVAVCAGATLAISKYWPSFAPGNKVAEAKRQFTAANAE